MSDGHEETGNGLSTGTGGTPKHLYVSEDEVQIYSL